MKGKGKLKREIKREIKREVSEDIKETRNEIKREINEEIRELRREIKLDLIDIRREMCSRPSRPNPEPKPLPTPTPSKEIFDKTIDAEFISLKDLGTIFYDATDKDLATFFLLFDKHHTDFAISCQFDACTFLAQILSEVGPSLVGVRENLNYACDALDIFSYYQNNPSEAQADGRCGDHEANQVNIGNKAYGDRLGNGSPDTDDGYTFRGGGFFQLTGRDHYTNITNGINLKNILRNEATPELLAVKITNVYWGLLSAMSYWELYCDQCSTIDCTTQAINYYTDSYQKREDNYNYICSVVAS